MLRRDVHDLVHPRPRVMDNRADSGCRVGWGGRRAHVDYAAVGFRVSPTFRGRSPLRLATCGSVPATSFAGTLSAVPHAAGNDSLTSLEVVQSGGWFDELRCQRAGPTGRGDQRRQW